MRPLVVSLAGLLWSMPVSAQSLTPEQRQATVSWVQSLQKPSGGFAADAGPDSPASLCATTWALGALRHFSGEPKDARACAKYVKRCYQRPRSCFVADPDDEKAGVRTTAFGVMAAAHLELPRERYIMPPVIFLCSRTRQPADIHVTAAAYESVDSECGLNDTWIAALERKQNADGTFGAGKSVIAETARSVVTLRRLGARIEKLDQIMAALQAAQLPDGGWGRDTSDLATTHHVVCALVRFNRKADFNACREFVARCRNADGSYSLQTDQPGTVAATCFAGAVLSWLDRNE